MTAMKRDKPYVWVTWITPLLSGDAQCTWAAWFKANHKYKSRPSDFDSAAWTARHNELLGKRATELEKDGWVVKLEDQNSFKLVGREGGCLSGKPDIVATREGRMLVIDCKTGQRRNSDVMQVLIYMLAMRRRHPGLDPSAISGELQYSDGILDVPAEGLDEEFMVRLAKVMGEVTGAEPPRRVPSYSECRFCPIREEDCPERISEQAVEHQVPDLF